MEEVLIKWINKLADDQIEKMLVVSEVDMNHADPYKPGTVSQVIKILLGYTVSRTILQGKNCKIYLWFKVGFKKES